MFRINHPSPPFAWCSRFSEVLCVLACAIPRTSAYQRHCRMVIFLTIVSLGLYTVFFTPDQPTSNTLIDYVVGCSIAIRVFMMSDFLLLTDLQTLRWTKNIKSRQGERREASGKENYHILGFLGRLWWSFNLLSSPRGIGWAHQVPSTLTLDDPTSRPLKQSKFQFITRKTCRLLSLSLFYELLDIPIQLHPSFPPFSVSNLLPLLLRVGLVWTHIFELKTRIEILYEGMSLVFVSIGLSEPSEEDWPPLFGSIREVWSVRRFWGCVTFDCLTVCVDSRFSGGFGIKFCEG